MRKTLFAASAALLALLPLAVSAQEVPSYASSGDEQIHGRIVAFDGAYDLTVRDDAGYDDAIQLHQGTIINPTGLTLAPGMVVSVDGTNDGQFFAANEIDTPYQIQGDAVPYYSGHPWNYYGDSISLGFFFGNAGWWQGGGYGRGYDSNVRIVNVYNANEHYRNRSEGSGNRSNDGGNRYGNQSSVDSGRRYPTTTAPSSNTNRGYVRTTPQESTTSQQRFNQGRTYAPAAQNGTAPTRTYAQPNRTYSQPTHTYAQPTHTYSQPNRGSSPSTTHGSGGAPSHGSGGAPSHDSGHGRSR